MREKMYDFINFVSFPSSAKTLSDEPTEVTGWFGRNYPILKVTPGSKVMVEVYVKQENVVNRASYVAIQKYVDGRVEWWLGLPIPKGTFNWTKFNWEIEIPSDFSYIAIDVRGGSGFPNRPGVTWWDDLRIYRNGKLVYEDNFTNWNLYLGSIPLVAVGSIIGFNETKKLIKI